MKPDRGWIATGRLVGADFSDNTLEFRIEGDMGQIAGGRYTIVPAGTFMSILRRADLWTKSQEPTA